MKTIYESILSSTKTGKTAITKEKIEKWIDANIPYLKNAYEINNDLQICSNCLIRIPEGLTEIPKYIKFGDVNDIALNCDVNILTKEQFPTSMNTFLISGRANNVIDIKFPLKINNRFSFSAFPHLVKEIKNLEVEFPDTTSKHFKIIDLDTTNIEIKDIKNINAKNITNLYIKDTPAAKKIMRNVNKFIKDKDNDKLNDYLNDIFSHMPNIENVFTLQRTILRKGKISWFKL
jgi:hypothetical protein